MSVPVKKYPAKLILFGEYTVLLGGEALGIPLLNFSANWEMEEDQNQYLLLDFIDFLEKESSGFFDLPKMRSQIEQGLYLKSNIPQGSGLGSSAAVCVAVFNEFKKENFEELNDVELTSLFAKMESFFHGNSSGFDPMIIHKSKTLLKRNQTIRTVEEKLKFPHPVFLLDSGQSRIASHLIQGFKDKLSADSSFRNEMEYLNEVNTNCIQALIQGKEYIQALKELSQIQYHSMNEMLVSSIQDLWKNGLEKDEYYIKLCGAGGGGFYTITFHRPHQAVKGLQNFNGFTLYPIA